MLKKDQARLYELIWKRSLASQMASAEIDRVSVDIASDDGRTGLRATGQTVAFDGFLRVYQEGRDDARRDNGDDADGERRLPAVTVGEAMAVADVTPNKHVTEPPPRFSEASLVRRLEELGIGRPSTYASIISVLQDRNYVRLEKRRFVPEDRGRIVTVFLENFFSRYVEYDFTASLEGQLDTISAGEIDWRAVLSDFWRDFAGAVEETKGLRVKHVLDALDETLGLHLFPAGDGGEDRRCPSCADGRLGLKLGRYGPFVGCANYPDCKYTRPLADNGGDAAEPRTLGNDPETDQPISLKRGPYGLYVERAVDGATKEKPKRVSLPQDLAPDLVDLQTALGLLSLPREIGTHPESGKPVTAGIGRFGAYVKHDGAYRSLPRGENVLDVGLNRAVVLIAEKKGGARLLRELGAHPDGGQAVTLHTGRYGPYVQHGRLRASLPKGASDDDLTLDEAVKLLAAKAAKGGAKKKSAGRGRKSASAKTGTARSKSKRGSRRQADAPADGAP